MTGDKLKGEDTKTTITIIDDDKPGTLGFQSRSVKALASEKKVEVTIERKDGCDGLISCDFATCDIGTERSAKAGEDYVAKTGTLEFVHG